MVSRSRWNHGVGVGAADSEGLGEVWSIQAVAEGQLEDGAVAVGTARRRPRDQIGEFGACGQGVRAGLMRHVVRQFVRWCFAATFPESGAALRCERWHTARAQFVGSRSCV